MALYISSCASSTAALCLLSATSSPSFSARISSRSTWKSSALADSRRSVATSRSTCSIRARFAEIYSNVKIMQSRRRRSTTYSRDIGGQSGHRALHVARRLVDVLGQIDIASGQSLRRCKIMKSFKHHTQRRTPSSHQRGSRRRRGGSRTWWAQQQQASRSRQSRGGVGQGRPSQEMKLLTLHFRSLAAAAWLCETHGDT